MLRTAVTEGNTVDERIFLRFEQAGRPLRATSFEMRTGITFEEPQDGSPLNVALGLQSLQPARLTAVQQRHGWTNGQFALDARLVEGGILFSGAGGDAAGLPPGPYDLTVEVESYAFRNGQTRIFVKDGASTTLVLQVKPDTRRIVLSDNFDAKTAALIDASTVDTKPMAGWLDGKVRPVPRVQRRACVLNVLARLAAPPMPKVKRGLTGQFLGVHFADVDRIYASADPELHDVLKGFVKADGWKAEGSPTHPIHKRLVADAIARVPELQGKAEHDFDLQSYRQGGRTGLQIVVAIPRFAHPVVYADIDIDLGNPLWDLQGVFIHLGEILDGGPTDHFKVHEKLAKMLPPELNFYKVKS